MSRIGKILKTLDFIEYISKPMEKKDVLLIYKINKVSQERSELLLDFISSLYSKMIKTYMGDDLMSEEDQETHFKWCWDSLIMDFKKELIFFDKRGSLYNYFKAFSIETFYKEVDKSEKNTQKTLYFVINSFNYHKIRTKSELDSFLDLYKIFNKGFNVGV